MNQKVVSIVREVVRTSIWDEGAEGYVPDCPTFVFNESELNELKDWLDKYDTLR